MQRIKMLGMGLLLLGGTVLFADDNSMEEELDNIEIIADASGATSTAPTNSGNGTNTTNGSSTTNGSANTRSMTPAERQDSKIQKGMSQEDILNSPKTKAQSKMFSSPEHEETYRSLSPKNRVVFDSLSKSDQQRIINSYQNGEDPQRVMMKMLQRDQRGYDKERDGSEDWETQTNRDSPASRAMHSPSKREEPGPESQIFEPGME